MRISVILMVLLLLNTTVLYAQIMSSLLKEYSIWGLVLIEAILLVSYYRKGSKKELRKVFKIDLRNLRMFSGKEKRSA